MFDKNQNNKREQQKKKALLFTTKKGITFSTLTKTDIENNMIKEENRETTKISQRVINSEVDEKNEFNGNNE